jgi:hypothetical protein
MESILIEIESLSGAGAQKSSSSKFNVKDRSEYFGGCSRSSRFTAMCVGRDRVAFLFFAFSAFNLER